MQKINDRYTFDPTSDELGKGGFGRVFRAHDTLLDRKVVLKMAEQGSLPDRYSLVKEISRVIEFSHPNLVRYYDAILLETTNQFGEDIQYQIGVLEYVSGGDLRDFLASNPSMDQIRHITRGILEGLAYLHKRNTIHRDIKPPNILLQPENGMMTAKICDFGISKSAGSEATALSNVIGTFEYMSPEQLGNNPDQKISTNSDLWSFGVLLYELFMGEVPFGSRRGGASNATIVSSILSAQIPDKIREINAPYREIIEACLIKDATERVQKAEELLAILDKQEAPKPKPTPIQQIAETPPPAPVPAQEPVIEAVEPPPIPKPPQSEPKPIVQAADASAEHKPIPKAQPVRQQQKPKPKAQPDAPKNRRVTHPMALSAFFISFVPFIGMLSIPLGAISMNKISKEPTSFKGRAFSIIGIIIGLVWVSIFMSIA